MKKTIKQLDLINHIKNIIAIQEGIVKEYLYFIIHDSVILDKDMIISRNGLETILSNWLDDFDYERSCEEVERWLNPSDYNLIKYINKLICNELLPTWLDEARAINLGELVNKYDLDIDELYFDVDSGSIKDKEGNVWAD